MCKAKHARLDQQLRMTYLWTNDIFVGLIRKCSAGLFVVEIFSVFYLMNFKKEKEKNHKHFLFH